MAKKDIRQFLPDGTLNPKFLEQLKRQTLIQSTAASLRLSGVKITENEVERIVHGSTIKKD